jgi:hypothetical protein
MGTVGYAAAATYSGLVMAGSGVGAYAVSRHYNKDGRDWTAAAILPVAGIGTFIAVGPLGEFLAEAKPKNNVQAALLGVTTLSMLGSFVAPAIGGVIAPLTTPSKAEVAWRRAHERD